MEVLLIVGVLGVIIVGSFLGILAFTRVGEARGKIELLERRLQVAEDRLAKLARDASPPRSASAPGAPEQGAAQAPTAQAPAAQEEEEDAAGQETPVPQPESHAAPKPTTQPPPAAPVRPAPPPLPGEETTPQPARAAHTVSQPPAKVIRAPGPMDAITKSLQENWMTWLGGVSLGLAGIFLVVYSIEQGILGPTARVVLAAVAGLAMQAAGEYLRRKRPEVVHVFASLAAAGSITLFAAVVAAFQLYELIGVTTTFFLLALVAFVTMFLALLHGPMLAALGLLGAYAVPVLVSTGTGNTLIALTYAAIVTAAGLGLLRYVYRFWLWVGLLVGAGFWWLVTLGDSHIHMHMHGAYLAVLGYLFVAIPARDYFLMQPHRLTATDLSVGNLTGAVLYEGEVSSHGERLRWVFLSIAAALGISFSLGVLEIKNVFAGLLSWTPPLVLSLWLARYKEQLSLLSWAVLGGYAIGALVASLNVHDDRLYITAVPEASVVSVLGLLFGVAAFSAAMGIWNYLDCRFKQVWASVVCVIPALFAITGYLITDGPPSAWAQSWVLGFLIYGVVYLIVGTLFARRPDDTALAVWGYFAGHLGVAVAAAIALSPYALTVVLAAQLVTLAWLVRAFQVDLTPLIKLLATLLVIRLTANPWLLDYPANVHWTLVSYGGTLVCSIAALWVLRSAAKQPAFSVRVQPWLEGVSMHFFVLFTWTELRYWLYDGNVFQDEFTALEASLNVILFGLIALVYYRRSLVSVQVEKLYRGFAVVTGVIAAVNYTIIFLMTLLGLSWIHGDVSTTPIFNQGLLMFAAPVVISLLIWIWGMPGMRLPALLSAVAGSVLFINLQIRHFWTGSFDLYQQVSDGEMITYSGVWLVLAVGVLLYGGARLNTTVYRTGMLVLAGVIAKIFLLDMADLQGLLRVASFFGLGLALLGLSFMHQKLKPTEQTDA